jgi:hypothetical protein
MDYVFATRGAAIAGAASGLSALVTLGDQAAGDLGGARYARVASEPAHPGKFKDNLNQWWELSEQIVNAQMFGGVVSSSAVLDVTNALRDAVAYAAAKLGVSVRLTPGFHGVSDAITVPTAMIIEGSGRGVTAVAGAGGTCLRKLTATGHVFHIQARGAVVIRDMTIDAGVTHTDSNAAAIFVEGDSAATYNFNSLFDNLFIAGLQNGLRIKAAINWSLRDCVIMDFRNIGVFLSGEGFTGSNGDDCTGHSRVQDCVIWALNTSDIAQACVRYDCGGDFRVLGSKLLGAQFGVRVVLNRGPTGTLLVSGGNSFEQQTVACVYLQQGVAGKTFGNVTIVGNQFSIVQDGLPVGADPQGTIILAGGSSPDWIRNIVVSGNVINHGYAPSVDRATIAIDSGAGVVVDANVINFNASSSHHYGIAVGAAATQVTLGYGNKVLGLTAPGRKYGALSANVKLFDGDGVGFATLPTVADGSLIYVSDGAKGSPPALAGGSTGATARRLAGAWYV